MCIHKMKRGIAAASGWLHRLLRRHVEHNQTSRLSCRARPAALFLKGTFEILANTRAGDPATIPDARHRCGSIFEAMSPIQATAPYQGFLLSVGTKRSPTT
jgi:hypothetical protein